MRQDPDAPAREVDDGTWSQSDQNDQSTPPEPLIRPQAEEIRPSSEPVLPEMMTVPGAHTTPTPAPTADSKDSAESDESTPRPSAERSDEWDLLPVPKIEKGEVIFGKYFLEEKLGEGGMGQVWRVENVPLQRESALKLIKPEIAQNNKGWQRFEREARLMAKIKHPNAVGVYAFQRSHSMGYIEMEFVPGLSLHDYLKQRKGEPLPLPWIAQFLDQLCSVLQMAHGHIDKKSGKAKPIIHRDLKPSNLMLAEDLPPDQNLKVLDFGIAKIVEDEGSPELTGAGDFLGTPDYMSPEQIRGGITKEGKGDIDGRSDLYSVGIILYQLLTGSLPFRGMSKMAVVGAHLHGTVPPMKETNPAARVPAEVERLVMKCLDKNPDKRPQTARELAKQFRAAIGGVETTKPDRHPSARLAPRIAVACLLIAVLILGGALLLHRVGWRNSTVGPGPVEVTERPGDKTGKGQPLTTTSTPSDETTKDKPSVWLPKGYEVAEPLELASDAADETLRIRRTADNIELYRLKPGFYLPVGYEPESPNMIDVIEGWPRVIVRSSAKQVRFIRLAGKTYLRGDGRSGVPARDTAKNPCSPHWVRLSGFYIQETEVTHEEIEKYAAMHPEPETADNLKTWEDYHKRLSKHITSAETLRRYPAACISYIAARKYARDMGGRLPTEAEWEFAAKSCNDAFLFPWGDTIPAKGSKPKANVSIPGGFTGLLPIRSFEGDRTDQYIFDLTGNVRELCLDAYEPYSNIIKAGNSTRNPLLDPCVRVEPRPGTPTKYVVKGGSFQSSVQWAMAFQRHRALADDTADDIGFRLVIECPPAR